MQRILFQTSLLRIGTFRCHPTDPLFEDSGPIGGYLLVFPRTTVKITYAGAAPVVADPTVVMFYNQRQEYRRSRVSARGDHCEWFDFAPQLIREALASADPGALDRDQHLFRFSHGPSDPRSYLLQRLVVEHLLTTTTPDPLLVEERMLHVLDQSVHTAHRAWQGPQPAPQRAAPAVTLAAAVKEVLATCFREHLTLSQLAHAVASSPAHLCRIFHQQTGMTIHHYRLQLRLRAALEGLTQTDLGLTALGIDLGFASHSHFTQAFHRAFGLVPSQVRQGLAARHLQELSKILIV